MDPTANACELFQLAMGVLRDIQDTQPDDAVRLAELAVSLIEWRATGGFDPKWDLVRDVIERENRS